MVISRQVYKRKDKGQKDHVTKEGRKKSQVEKPAEEKDSSEVMLKEYKTSCH